MTRKTLYMFSTDEIFPEIFSIQLVEPIGIEPKYTQSDKCACLSSPLSQL
jgi:hypothetical protein